MKKIFLIIFVLLISLNVGAQNLGSFFFNYPNIDKYYFQSQLFFEPLIFQKDLLKELRVRTILSENNTDNELIFTQCDTNGNKILTLSSYFNSFSVDLKIDNDISLLNEFHCEYAYPFYIDDQITDESEPSFVYYSLSETILNDDSLKHISFRDSHFFLKNNKPNESFIIQIYNSKNKLISQKFFLNKNDSIPYMQDEFLYDQNKLLEIKSYFLGEHKILFKYDSLSRLIAVIDRNNSHGFRNGFNYLELLTNLHYLDNGNLSFIEIKGRKYLDDLETIRMIDFSYNRNEIVEVIDYSKQLRIEKIYIFKNGKIIKVLSKSNITNSQLKYYIESKYKYYKNGLLKEKVENNHIYKYKYTFY